MDRKYLDPIIGLVLPGAGDALGSLLGLYGVLVAINRGVHPVVVARMLINLALDSLAGAIPFVGWAFDFVFRAHVRNLELVRDRKARGGPSSADWLWVGLAFSLFFVAIVLPPLLLVAALIWIATAF